MKRADNRTQIAKSGGVARNAQTISGINKKDFFGVSYTFPVVLYVVWFSVARKLYKMDSRMRCRFRSTSLKQQLRCGTRWWSSPKLEI